MRAPTVTPSPTPEPTPIGSAVPNVSIPPWDGKERLNILLIGADTQGGGHRTDTMITVSIDPVTKQVAMFSLPRDTKGVPIPPGPARSVWGRTYGDKINAFFINNRRRADLWPGSDKTRGYNALKAVLGELYDLDIKYFVEVDFDGFKDIVNAMDGVTVNVQIPVVDDAYPAGKARNRRLYIPSGLQHMTGAEALRYARSRNTSSDFDRAARQQRLLLSMREQADPQELIPRLPELVEGPQEVDQDGHPARPDRRAAGPRLRRRHREHPLVRVLPAALPAGSPDGLLDDPVHRPHPGRGQEGLQYATRPTRPVARSWPARARRSGCSTGPARRTAARDWRATSSTRAWRPPRRDRSRKARSRPRRRSSSTTAPRPSMAETIAYLEKRFKTTVTTATDPTVRADIVITIGQDTPNLEPPPSS